MIICQLTDLHVRPHGTPAYGVVSTNMMLERALRRVAALRPQPDLVVVSGDLTDCGLDMEYEILAELLQRYLTMPVYLVPGNHDRREVMKEKLGHLPGITDDPDFVQYVIDDFPLRLVMLDSVVPGRSHGELCTARLDFLDRSLSAAPDKPTLVVLHHPPTKCGLRNMDTINLHSAEEFGAIIKRHPQVERILCGHSHRVIVTRFAGTIVQVAPSTAHQVSLDLDPAMPETFSLEPPSFLLHRWNPVTGLATHQAYIESYPGPYPFVLDKAYPGATAN